MNTSVLYDYMLKHTYSSPMGLVATILGFMSILFFAKGAGVLYLVIGIIIIAYLPWNLFLIARKQAITNESFQKPLHYTFAEDGVYISQGDVVQMQAWENMFKAVSTPRSIIIYTSKVNASIFPRKDLGDGAATVIELICKHMPPKKVKIRQ
ncbi:MAG: YcxB family protein [Lachnospiraceae bacterium]|nr:YcxB family protein [Lachnospiraceae bacterium]